MTRTNDRYAQKRAQRERERESERRAWRRLVALAEGGKYSPEQPRDDHGRFGEGEGGGADTPFEENAAFGHLSLKEKEAFLNAAQKEWKQGLSRVEQWNLRGYARGMAFDLNRLLRGKETNDEGRAWTDITLENLKESQGSLRDALMRAPGAPVDMVVYRSFSLRSTAQENQSMAELFQSRLGQTFTDQGFVSTTISQDTAQSRYGTNPLEENSGSVTATIRLPAGSPGAYIQNWSDKGDYQYLLPDNAQFKVDRVATDSSGRQQVQLTYLGSPSPSASATPGAKAHTESGDKAAHEGAMNQEERARLYVWQMDDIQWGTDEDTEGDAGRMARPTGRKGIPSSSSFQAHLAARLARRRGN